MIKGSDEKRRCYIPCTENTIMSGKCVCLNDTKGSKIDWIVIETKPKEDKVSKEQFFVQYWGQKVGRESVSKDDDGFERNYIINHHTILNIKNDFLELKPLSNISDEDLEGLIEVSNWIVEKDTLTRQLEVNTVLQSDYPFTVGLVITDYLRSRGYALPYRSISVEEQVKLGWIKLV